MDPAREFVTINETSQELMRKLCEENVFADDDDDDEVDDEDEEEEETVSNDEDHKSSNRTTPDSTSHCSSSNDGGGGVKRYVGKPAANVANVCNNGGQRKSDLRNDEGIYLNNLELIGEGGGGGGASSSSSSSRHGNSNSSGYSSLAQTIATKKASTSGESSLEVPATVDDDRETSSGTRHTKEKIVVFKRVHKQAKSSTQRQQKQQQPQHCANRSVSRGDDGDEDEEDEDEEKAEISNGSGDAGKSADTTRMHKNIPSMKRILFTRHKKSSTAAAAAAAVVKNDFLPSTTTTTTAARQDNRVAAAMTRTPYLASYSSVEDERKSRLNSFNSPQLEQLPLLSSVAPGGRERSQPKGSKTNDINNNTKNNKHDMSDHGRRKSNKISSLIDPS